MNPKFRIFLVVTSTSLLAISASRAATLTWNNGGATGSWNNTDLNWTGVAWNNLTPDDAVFGATGVGTITLTQAITAGSMTFNTAGYTIDTSTFGLTLNTGITANQNATIQSGTGGSLILGANNAWSVASSMNLTVSSTISGSTFGITKSGAGTLTLSGPNTYGGGTTLSGGTVAISNATAFGASSGNILVNANSRINAAALTYANAISINGGTVLSLQNTGAANSTATFSGAITGAGGITLVQGSSSGTTIALTNTNNTFTGNITLPTGSGANDFISFASIGDGGAIIYGRPSWRSGATYTGAADLNLSTRTITLATTFGGSTGLDGGGNPINMFANSGTGVVTISQNMVMTSFASSGFFFFGGTNAGNNTFSGLIGDPTGTNTLGIGKWDAGKWILSNANNSFEGNILLGNGTLSVAALSIAGNAQALGKGTLIQLGQGNSSGTLEVTGAGNSTTNKQFVIGSNNNNHSGQGSILNNGSGTLTFTNAVFNSITQNSGLTTRDRTLTLGGSNTGANLIEGTIQDHVTGNALISLAKTGAGTWVLSGANTYTGGTTVSQGTLVFRNTGAKSGTGTHAFAAGTTLGLGVGGAGFFSSTDITNAFTGTMTGNLSGITVTTTTNVGIDTTAGNFTHSTDITGTSKGLTKLGANSLTLEGANTYTGATTVREGTLIVNGSLGNTAVTVDGGAFGGTGSIGSILTITSGSFHVANINDALLVTGAVTLYAGFGVDDLTGITWGSVADGTYTLIDGTLGAGVFAGLANNSLLTAYDIGGGRSAYFQEGSLQLVVIPEPRALLLGSLGILLLLRRRR